MCPSLHSIQINPKLGPKAQSCLLAFQLHPFGSAPTHLPLCRSDSLLPPLRLVVFSFASLSLTPTLRPTGVCVSRLPREDATAMPTLRIPPSEDTH